MAENILGKMIAQRVHSAKRLRLSPEQIFMISTLVVNGGNYLYNLILGRYLGPTEFADASVLITFLLILSFAAMTLQLVSAKFVVQFEAQLFKAFVSKLGRVSLILGVVVGVLIVAMASWLQNQLNTTSSWMFAIFGLGIPIYFYLSVQRGIFHGSQQFIKLSLTYQLEMGARLLFTLVMLMTLPLNSSVIVALGVVISLLASLIPIKKGILKKKIQKVLSAEQSKMVKNFIIITIIYEFTQIIINNSDILLVKHYFNNYDAGLYASLALIGRAVYFITWMFVMLLLPKVIEAKKKGFDTAQILYKNLLNVGGLCALIVIMAFIFPDTIVYLLFGEEYLHIAGLLWKYALATSFFALSNIFTYYFLSLERYFSVLVSGVFGLIQIASIVFFHRSLDEVVEVQIVIMLLLLIVQIAYFMMDSRKQQISIRR